MAPLTSFCWLITSFGLGIWISSEKKNIAYTSASGECPSLELSGLRGQERRPNEHFWNAALTLGDPTEHHHCRFTVSNLPLSHSSPFLILKTSKPWLEGPVVSECSVFFLNGFLDLLQKDFQNILFPFSPSAFSALKARYNIFPILLLPINSASMTPAGEQAFLLWTCYCLFQATDLPWRGGSLLLWWATSSLSVILSLPFNMGLIAANASSFSQLWYPGPS